MIWRNEIKSFDNKEKKEDCLEIMIKQVEGVKKALSTASLRIH